MGDYASLTTRIETAVKMTFLRLHHKTWCDYHLLHLLLLKQQVVIVQQAKTLFRMFKHSAHSYSLAALCLITVVLMTIKSITAVCVYVQINNYVTQQTCSESRFGWRLLHDHGEGGRGW